jgi:hypothetical protein
MKLSLLRQLLCLLFLSMSIVYPFDHTQTSMASKGSRSTTDISCCGLELGYQKMFKLLQTRHEHLKHSNLDMAKELSNTTRLTKHLAFSLGFNNIHDAQKAIDSVDH